ncbi:MAG: 5'/3'-nucleotidase SurE [Candidatus Izemoplasmatales bacterium]|jgi:5'-nucleotidase|nr:5'/3'-nucleotidase SurE [Candidatus Izemoplasmatales bacterium]
MNILLTNDDGYNAEGIQILYRKLQRYGKVLLVAPHHHMSGASVSRIFWDEAVVHHHTEDIISVEGTPADAVAFALHALDFEPDLIVSGINDGFNVGADTVYSGTVGACMEALKAGKKAIAFSADYHYFEPAEKEFEAVMDYVLEHDLLSNEYLLNINFVSRKFTEAKGIMITDLGFRPAVHFYTRNEHGTYQNKRKFLPYDFIEGTDLYAIEYGWTSITPLKFGNQSDKGLLELKQKVAHIE